MDAVSAALLERGPVVAGITWHDSMDAPQDLGGRFVCRVAPDSAPRGGHGVVLNGVLLDEEIDGVRGFVRFKNSWGREWGQAGQALISIEDLARVLQGDALLPIPAQAALGPDGRQGRGAPGTCLRSSATSRRGSAATSGRRATPSATPRTQTRSRGGSSTPRRTRP